MFSEKAQSIWKEADPDYESAMKTRQKLAGLEALDR
jgi:hypothetical protein